MNNRFNGEMLALARQVRKVSQPELAKRLKGIVSQAQLSKIENGHFQPDEKIIERIAETLGFRPSFFRSSTYRRVTPVSFHRKRQKLGVKDLESIHGQAEIYRINLKILLDSVDLETRLPSLPGIDPDQHDGRIGQIADIVRQRWSIPRGPLKELTRVAEDAGVIVVAFDFGTPLIDGFSQHATDGLPPIVFINSSQPKDRYRYSLAHEIGHLCMHHTPNPEMEVQANLFASELLMPRRDIEPQLYNLSLKKFMDLKLHWRTSMQSIIYKAWETGRISDRMFKYYNIEMARRGFKTREPVALSGVDETPTAVRDLVQAHLTDLEYSVDDLGEMFGLHEGDLRAMYPVPSNRPQLRLVI